MGGGATRDGGATREGTQWRMAVAARQSGCERTPQADCSVDAASVHERLCVIATYAIFFQHKYIYVPFPLFPMNI
jgi:hypothetical protein